MNSFLLNNMSIFRRGCSNYISGEKEKTDYVRIYLWWKIASERQAEGADEKLLGLTKMMSEDEMREARVLIKKCRSMTMKQCLPFMLPGNGLRPL